MRHIAYLGIEQSITESRASDICRREGLDIEQLRQVRGLELVPDGQAPSSQPHAQNSPGITPKTRQILNKGNVLRFIVNEISLTIPQGTSEVDEAFLDVATKAYQGLPGGPGALIEAGELVLLE